jgi:hypothetical protein
LDALDAVIADHDGGFPERRRFQGQILRTMRKVVVEAPDGLRTVEI